MASTVTIQTTVHASIEKAWAYWTEPAHMMKWNFASNDWCCPSATNDLRTGGTFTSRMEAKDGSFGFDFGGTYTLVEPLQKIAYTMGDGRTVDVTFTTEGEMTKIVERFDAETQNSIQKQQDGWQAILNNYKKHVEND